MNDKTLCKYLLGAFGLAWPIQALAAWFFRQGQAQVYQLLLMLSMYAPFAAVLLARIPLRGMGWKPQLKGNVRWLFAAWFVPAVLGLLGAALYFGLFPSRLDLTGAYLTAQLGEAGMAQLEAAGLSVKSYVLVQAAAALGYAPWLNMLAALGEEVGWRGALYPRLKERFGTVKGRLVGGLIWGVWHWPIMVLAGYEYGLHYWGAPLLGMLLFCIFTIAAGTLLDLVYEKTSCLWFPSLAHGAINAFAGLPLLVLNPAYADRLTVGPLMIGVLGGLPMILLSAWVLWRRHGDTYSPR